MTLIVYSGQLIAEEICSGAKREFEQPVVGAKLEAIITLIAARGLSLAACAYSFGNAVFSSGKRAIKIICIPLDEAFSPDAIVRTSIATALIVSLVFLRVVSSLGGFVSPELMFGVFKVHRFLFRLAVSQISICSHRQPSSESLPRLYRPSAKAMGTCGRARRPTSSELRGAQRTVIYGDKQCVRRKKNQLQLPAG